jgi:hypothetical protein
MNLSVDQRSNADGSVSIHLRGTIDERADIERLFTTLTGPLRFNLREVERINSIGIARWISNFADYSKRFPTVVEEVSYAFAIQANAIANLFGKATVTSCLAPYFCGRCAQSRMCLVTREELLSARDRAPERRCSVCESVMPFDDLESYFNFLSD